MSSFFRALKIAVCSAELRAFRICVAHGCLAIMEVLVSVLGALYSRFGKGWWRCALYIYRQEIIDERQLFDDACA